MTDQLSIDMAEQAGRQAALDHEPFGKNPYSMAQGSPTRVLAIAWRRGYRAGEIEADDAAGDLFRGTAK